MKPVTKGHILQDAIYRKCAITGEPGEMQVGQWLSEARRKGTESDSLQVWGSVSKGEEYSQKLTGNGHATTLQIR